MGSWLRMYMWYCQGFAYKTFSALPPGSLVKDGHFSLFSAVCALEIMDPKMDSGFLAPGHSHEETYDVTKPLTPEEILGVLDQLLCHEMAWHLGYPLSQTVFTSKYVDSITKCPITTQQLDNRDQVPDLLLFSLRAYCLALIKTCHWVNETIRAESFYEEEDFVTNTYNRYMVQNIENSDIQLLLHQARDGILSMEPRLAEEIVQALECRLELRHAFLASIEVTKRHETMTASREAWVQMEGLVESVKQSHPLAKPVPEAFSAKLQRHLASTVPPRPIVELSFEDAHVHFRRLVDDGVEALSLLDYNNIQSRLVRRLR